MRAQVARELRGAAAVRREARRERERLREVRGAALAVGAGEERGVEVEPLDRAREERVGREAVAQRVELAPGLEEARDPRPVVGGHRRDRSRRLGRTRARPRRPGERSPDLVRQHLRREPREPAEATAREVERAVARRRTSGERSRAAQASASSGIGERRERARPGRAPPAPGRSRRRARAGRGCPPRAAPARTPPIWVRRRNRIATSPRRGRRGRSAPPSPRSRTSTPARPRRWPGCARAMAAASRRRRSGGVASPSSQELAGGARALRPAGDEPILVGEADLVVPRRGAVRRAHAAGEHLVHEVDDRGRGAVVVGQVQHPPLARPEPSDEPREHGDVRAAEPVDGLLEIAHRDEQPGPRGLPGPESSSKSSCWTPFTSWYSSTSSAR